MKRLLLSALCLMLIVSNSMAVQVALEQDQDPGLIDLLKAIRPLTTLSSYMNTAAHPDDENSALLALLALGKGTQTHLVTITRGQGGQNAIGPEHYDAMGVLRTEELGRSMDVLATTVDYIRYDFDSPAKDFGFSKKWEETEEKWDFNFVIERMAYYFRLYRPQVVLLPFNFVRSQHGHHQAIYVCALRALEAAADPTKYPEHKLPAFVPYKVYEPATESRLNASEETGAYDPWYGKTYEQIGQFARLFHACQGMGSRSLPTAKTTGLMAVDAASPRLPLVERPERLFDRIPTTYSAYAAMTSGELSETLLRLEEEQAKLMQAFPRHELLIPVLAAYRQNIEKAASLLVKADMEQMTKDDLTVQLNLKLTQVDKAIAEAAGLKATIISSDMSVTPGQKFVVDVRMYQGLPGEYRVDDVTLRFPNNDQWVVTQQPDEGELKPGGTVIKRFEVIAPADADFYNAFHGDELSAVLSVSGPMPFKIEAHTEGNFAYLPELSVKLTPDKAAINLLRNSQPQEIRATVTNMSNASASARVVIQLPNGWTAEPKEQMLEISPGAIMETAFQISAPKDVTQGTYMLKASAITQRGSNSKTVQTIEYAHINRTYYLYDAQATLVAFPLAFDSRKVGYVDSGSDEVAATLQALGMDVTLLSDDDLLFGDLNQYDTIMTGIRAYARRPVLKQANQRLMMYVKNGGHFIVQYHTSGDGYEPELAPLPLTVGKPSLAWRVTYEDSPVTMLLPEHPFLNTPNKITAEDFSDWVQERSLYIPMDWDSAYETPIRSGTVEQEGAEYDGQILTAPYGKGRFTYTALVFFRQVPNLVPGGIRLLANIINTK